MSSLDLPDESATASFATRVAAAARPGDVIALWGALGIGKTSFARAFIRARAGAEEAVPSPTFTLVQVYDLPGGAVWHFDCYRLRRPEEIWELGIEEALADGITLIEWPDRLASLLPAERLDLHLLSGARPQSRRAELTASASWAGRMAAVTT